MILRSFLCAYFLLFSLSYGEEIDLRRHIQVDATAKLLVDPDFARWQIKIRGEAASLGDASKKLEESSLSLKKALSEAGFKEDVIRLSGISSGRRFEGRGDSKVLKGFFAERSALVELRDLTERQVIEGILLGDDCIEVSQMSAQSSKHAEHRKQAILNAAKAAKEKARELAKALDAEIGVVLSIQQENRQYGWGYTTSNFVEDAPEEVEVADLEKLSYQATVTVKFELK